MTEIPGPRPAGAVRLPPGFAERLGMVAGDGAAPVTPRDAATVMLLRPRVDGTGLRVYMLRRVSSMAFAPGAFVFPGGSVDRRDAEADVEWAGPDEREWGAMLDAPPALARAIVCAAVRETFEESGVLLAGPTTGAVVTDTSGQDWEADRRALLDRSQSLAEMLRRRGLALRSDLLRPWSRWITPVIEARRYDTRFFAAALPGQQYARDVGGESDHASWVEPGDVLAAATRREVLLLPPTAVSLAELAGCGHPGAVLATSRRLTPRMPEISVTEDGTAWLTLPDGLEYPL